MKVKISSPGQKPITFQKGGLHESTDTPSGDKIPSEKVKAALSGSYGPKAKRQALFMRNVLTGGK
jgi:hypothetical protein